MKFYDTISIILVMDLILEVSIRLDFNSDIDQLTDWTQKHQPIPQSLQYSSKSKFWQGMASLTQ